MIKTGIYVLLGLFVVASTTGCLGRRMAVQSTVDAMRAEHKEETKKTIREIEDKGLELNHNMKRR